MLVFAAHASPRIKYLLDQILVHRLGLSYKLTDSPDYFLKSPSLRIHYGDHIVEGCLNIPAIPLLFEEHITEHPLNVKQNPKWKWQLFYHPFSHVPDFHKDTLHLEFDLFAACFYLLSRYEEYLPSTRDEHGRFRHQDSVAYTHSFLEIPLVDHWIEQFEICLKKIYPELVFKPHHARQLNTIDIDFAYKYKGHGLLPRARKLAGSVFRMKPDLNSIFTPGKDPYDTYDYMIRVAADHDIESIFFLLLADYGGNDKNISPLSDEMRLLSQRLSESFHCGIHPSYKAAINHKLYHQELKLFEILTQKKAQYSRYHFLKNRVPEAYVQLEEVGIEHDFTMSYSGHTGFRASTSRPYQLFNLYTNKVIPVWVHSACLMDVTLKNAMKLSADEAIEKIMTLKTKTEKVKGEFISIWHNSSFDESQGWQGWEKVYQALFQ